MSVETMVELIAREAEEEKASIIVEAERAARQLVVEAEAGVAARVARAVDGAGPEIRAAAQRRVNTVRLRILEERARVEAARLAAVFEAATARVHDIAAGGDPRLWSAALVALCDDALRSAGAGASVVVRSRDAGAIADLASRSGARLVALDDDAPAGVVVTSADGRVAVDASVPVRLQRASALMAERVARALALGPGHAAGGREG